MIVLKTQAFAARDLTTANGITILTSDAMPGSPAIHNVGAVIRIGSGEGGGNDLHANTRVLSLWLFLDGIPASRFDFTPRLDTPEVQTVISIPPFPVLAGQVVTLKLFSSNANDAAVKVAADLGSHDIDYFHAQVVPAADMTKIAGHEASAAALRTVLDGTGGAVLKAAQLKLACDVMGEGALDCRNISGVGHGQYNKGGSAGQYNKGDADGQANVGGPVGQYNEGSVDGQTNTGSIAQNNNGSAIGQKNRGQEAVRNEGWGATPKALTLVGAADRIDDILTDTADMQPRVGAIETILSGITSLAAWLRGLFRKSAMDAVAKAEVNLGGGTYDEAADSNEAIADELALISPPGVGSVVKVYTVTVAGVPESGVLVEVFNNIGMVGAAVAHGYTDMVGQVSLRLDPGTYYLRRYKAGVAFVNPDVEVVP